MRVNMRDKLFALEDAVLEIKSTAMQNEQNIQSQVEKENQKAFQNFNS